MGLQLGTSSSNTSGSGSSSGTMDSTSLPILSDRWLSSFDSLTGAAGADGLTPDQRTAADYYRGELGSGGSSSQYRRMADTYLGPIMQRSGTTLQSAASLYPELYGEQPEAVAGKVGGADAASEYMGAYLNPETDDYIGATLADLKRSFDESQNDLRANYGGQGWSATAGAPAGVQVAAAEGADDYLRNVASTVGGLRSDRFKTAIGAGAGDADRVLSGNVAQAGLDSDVSKYNASLLDSRQKFDIMSADAAADRRDQAARDYVASFMQSGGMSDADAAALFSTGQGGFGQLSDILTGARDTLGRKTTGTTSGTSTNYSSGGQSGASIGGK